MKATESRESPVEQASSTPVESSDSVVREFLPHCPVELNGIIAFLTKRAGANVHHAGIVSVKADVILGPAYPAKLAADLKDASQFISVIGEKRRIRYDFRGSRVAASGHALRSASEGFPDSWVIEVSDSGEEGSWVEVDRREKADFGFFQIQAFRCQKVLEARFVRLQSISTRDAHGLRLTAFELFGHLHSRD
jgi:hypothetical protein